MNCRLVTLLQNAKININVRQHFLVAIMMHLQRCWQCQQSLSLAISGDYCFSKQHSMTPHFLAQQSPHSDNLKHIQAKYNYSIQLQETTFLSKTMVGTLLLIYQIFFSCLPTGPSCVQMARSSSNCIHLNHCLCQKFCQHYHKNFLHHHHHIIIIIIIIIIIMKELLTKTPDGRWLRGRVAVVTV